MTLGTLTADQITARGGAFLRVWGRHSSRRALVRTTAGDLVELVECRCTGGDHWHLCEPERRPGLMAQALTALGR